MPYLLVLVRFLLPLTLPLWIKGVVAMLLLVASQYHLWCRLSSGSVFSPEFPRPVVILFTWAFGAILFLAILLLLLDAVTLSTMLVQRGHVAVPDGVRYAIAAFASLLAAVGVHTAVRVPPLKDVTIDIRGLPPQFDGYRMLQLTDLHISRLFPAAWTRRVVERSNALGVDLIVVTGDFIDGTLTARRADVEPLRDLRAPDGVYAIPGNHEYFFGYREWMRHLAGMGMHMLLNGHEILARGTGHWPARRPAGDFALDTDAIQLQGVVGRHRVEAERLSSTVAASAEALMGAIDAGIKEAKRRIRHDLR